MAHFIVIFHTSDYYCLILAQLDDFIVTIGNQSSSDGNPTVYTRTCNPVPASDKATIDLDPPRYGSVVGFKRLPSGWQYYYAGLCEVVVIGRRSIGMLY